MSIETRNGRKMSTSSRGRDRDRDPRHRVVVDRRSGRRLLDTGGADRGRARPGRAVLLDAGGAHGQRAVRDGAGSPRPARRGRPCGPTRSNTPGRRARAISSSSIVWEPTRSAGDRRAVDHRGRRPRSSSGCRGTGRRTGRPARCTARAACLLHDLAVAHHRRPIAHRHRLDLVVGDVQRGDAEPLLEGDDVGCASRCEVGVEARQRLVHQQQLRLANDRPPDRRPLLLAARQLAGWRSSTSVRCSILATSSTLRLDDRLARPSPAGARTDVLAHRHVRVEHVALEHHRHVAGSAACRG